MKAAVLKGIQNLEIEQIPAPAKPPAGHVKVEVKAVGICGSDVHYYQEGAIGDFILNSPMVLGHEVGGVVVEVGDGVNIPINSVVALEPGIPCGNCNHCRTGRYNLCPDVKFFATPPVNGAMTNYVIHPAAFTYVADGLTTIEASLAEPLSVGIYSARQAALHVGTKVAILGAGPVGLLTALACSSEGAIVTIFDVQPRRVQFARQFGFSSSLFQEKPEMKYDVVIDCSGNGEAIRWGQRSIVNGGKLILVGMGDRESMTLDALDLVARGISVQGIFRYCNTFSAAINLIRNNREKLSLLTKKQIVLEDLPEYLSTGAYKESLKTIVMID